MTPRPPKKVTDPSDRGLTLFRLCLLPLFLLTLLGSAAGALAAAGPWVANDQARLRLVPAGDAGGVPRDLGLGLHVGQPDCCSSYASPAGAAGYAVPAEGAGSPVGATAVLRWGLPPRFARG